MSHEEVALGFLRVANEVMVRPIREISVMRGFDIKEHALACLGGAAGQHACAIARELVISKIIIHRFAGILSAYGMGLADIVVEKQQPSASVLSENETDIIHKKLQKKLDCLANIAKKELINNFNNLQDQKPLSLSMGKMKYPNIEEFTKIISNGTIDRSKKI